MEHTNQQHQSGQDDWHLRKLWQYAKNRGFNIRVDNGFIRLTPSTPWNATSARSFPWNSAGIKAAHAWIDTSTATQHEPTRTIINTQPHQPPDTHHELSPNAHSWLNIALFYISPVAGFAYFAHRVYKQWKAEGWGHYSRRHIIFWVVLLAAIPIAFLIAFLIIKLQYDSHPLPPL